MNEIYNVCKSVDNNGTHEINARSGYQRDLVNLALYLKSKHRVIFPNFFRAE